MIYAYDLYLPLPVKDIYDTLMMLATVNAAKDMYEKGLKLMEDFNKKFGDFYSPIRSDMEWYDKYVTGNVRDTINQLYANGIDPLRSPEGRMLISRLINNMPVGTINQMKLSAAAAEEYLKNRGTLEAKGLFDPAYEDYATNGRTLDNWDTTRDGMWLRTSPAEYQGLFELTNDWYKDMKPSYLRTENGYDYSGVSPEAMAKVTREHIPDFIKSMNGQYQYQIAKRQLQAAGNANPTDEQITKQLEENIHAINSRVLHETREINPIYKMNREIAAQERIANIRASRSGDGSGGGSGSRSGGGGSEIDPQAGHNWDLELYLRSLANALKNPVSQQLVFDWTDLNAMRQYGAGGYIKTNATQWATNINTNVSGNSYNKKFIDYYTIPTSWQTFYDREPRNTGEEDSKLTAPNQYYPTDNDINRLSSEWSVISNVSGFDRRRGEKGITTSQLRKKIKDAGAGNVKISVRDGVFGAPLDSQTGFVPKQWVDVKINESNNDTPDWHTYRALLDVGPQSMNIELGTMPEQLSFIPSRVLKGLPKANQNVRSDVVQSDYYSGYAAPGNHAISTKLIGDSPQGVKYNGIIPQDFYDSDDESALPGYIYPWQIRRNR